jgi:hypothetical protein
MSKREPAGAARHADESSWRPRLVAAKRHERRAVTLDEYREMCRLTAEALSRGHVADRLGRPKSTVTEVMARDSGWARRLAS